MILIPATSQARILFVETFSTGTTPVASGLWNVNQTGTDFVLEEDSAGQGPGDGLLAILGTGDSGSPTWADNLYSKQSFPRGNNLRVGFRMWNKFGTNALSAFHGPFHNSGSGPVYANAEATLDYTYSTYRWGEATNTNPIQAGKTLTGVNSNYNGNTKNGSMLVKVRLGNTRGARLDWYRTDVNAPSNPKGEGEIDDIDQNFQPTGNTGLTTLTTGNAAQVYLGFGNFDGNVGTVYIDDIFVENDEVANPGGKTVLFVWATRDWRAIPDQGGGFVPGGDLRIMQTLEQMGYNVVQIDDHDVTINDVANVDGVILSAGVNATFVNTLFRDTSKGVLSYQQALFDDMNMTSGTTSQGTVASQTQINVDGSYTTLTTGLSGNVTVSVNNDNYRWGTVPPGAIKVASIVGNPAQTSIFAYEKGATMANAFTAPGRRVGFFMGRFRSSETLTPQGRQLFKAAVDWITAGPSAPRPTSATSWNIYQ